MWVRRATAAHISVLAHVTKEDLIRYLTETEAGNGFGNRFEKYVFPSLRQAHAGEASSHPDLKDGWRVQLFTDAAARSARSGRWETVE